MDLAWIALLIFTTWHTSVTSSGSTESRFFSCVKCTLVVCFVNVLGQMQWLQRLAHDAFVSILLYALLTSTCRRVRAFGLVTAALQMLTRWWYDRCLFLWWNTTRNVEIDVAVAILCLACLWRRGPIAPVWWCLLIGMATHFLPDDSEHSLTTRQSTEIGSITIDAM